jgi:NADH-quinone oxidoreductase subunit J
MMTALVALVSAQDAVPSSNTGGEIVFWLCATLAVVGALGLVMSRKAVHSALFVALTMINLAILYVANAAPFLGMVQVIVYTGAVMMLFLFVLMIVGVEATNNFAETIKGQRGWAAVLGVGFAALLIGAVVSGLSETVPIGLDAANAEYGGNVQGLAALIFGPYLLAFEVVAALLITAALGALVLAHREHLAPRKSQADLSRERFASGEHPGVLPNPGVISGTNAIGNPALLPDGSPALESVPLALRAPASAVEGRTGTQAIEGGED